MTPRSRFAVALTLLLAVSVAALPGAELQDRTNRAYDAYREIAEHAFVTRAQSGTPSNLRDDGIVSVRPAREDGIIEVPGGLVHHWTGGVFLSGVNLRRAIDLSRNYPSYTAIYKDIVASALLGQDGDTYRVMTRLKQGEAGVTAVLEVRSTVRYSFPTELNAYVISSADDIREVARAGSSSERLLPRGNDSGYLWRANVFTHFLAIDHGVYMEVETLGLSRGFPPMLGWVIEPIARRLGRKSVVTSLEEFRAALQTSS